MLFILDRACKFDETVEDEDDLRKRIDTAVSAELPSKDEDPQLYELVLKHMIHSPCQNNPKSICRDQGGKCKRDFPKEYCAYTKIV